MTEFEIGQLLYLVVLGTALVLMLFIGQRESLSTRIKHLATWALIFLGTIAAVGLWGDIRGTVMPQQSVFAEEGRIALPRAPDGHYYATIDINGAPVRFVVDTGATSIVLTRSDADRVGIAEESLIFLGEATTANGVVQTAPVSLETVSVGPITDRDVRAYVNAGEMDRSLLGMSYLSRFGRIEITNDTLVLER